LRLVLICLHGFLGHPDTFSAFLKPMPYEVVSLGYQAFIEDRPDAGFLDLATTLMARIKAQCLPGTQPVLYGYSMGGRLAMQLVQLDPGYFGGLILESAHLGGEQRTAQDWFEPFSQYDSADFVQAWYNQALFAVSKDKVLAQERARLVVIDQETIRRWAIQYHVSTHGSFLQELQKVPYPILAICGGKDVRYHTLYQHWEQCILQLTLHVVSGADHAVHRCAPLEVRHAVMAYLDQIVQTS